jgi:Tfp pilus assembly protein PilV
VTVLIIAVGIGGVSASEQQAQISVQNSAEKRPIVLVQNAAQKVPGNRRAKANVDAKGVILKGYDVGRLRQ